MNELCDMILNCMLAGITIWVIYGYFQFVFLNKNKNRFIMIILWASLYAVHVVIEFNKGEIGLWKFVLNVSVIILIAMILYGDRIRKKVLHVILLVTLWSIIELLVFCIFELMPIEAGEGLMLGSFFSKMLAIVFIMILRIRRLHIAEEISLRYTYFFLFIPIGSIYIGYHSFISTQKTTNVAVFGILLFINVLIFELYVRLVQSMSIERENTVNEQQLKMLLKYDKEKKQSIDEFNMSRHNIINGLIGIRGVVEDDSEAARALDEMISEGGKHIGMKSTSGNDVVDAVINYKYEAAKDSGLDLQMDIFIPKRLPYAHRDLGVILGNMWDNAIEAARECGEGSRIEISMGIRNREFFCIIKNPYRNAVRKNKNGQYLSTKPSKKKRGYGIESIRNITDKYGGVVTIEMIEDDSVKYFIMTVTLNLGEFMDSDEEANI